MAKQLQLRKGTATEHNTFTGANGEVTVDTTYNTLRVHDGSTVGGTRLATLYGGLLPSVQLPAATIITQGAVVLNDTLTSTSTTQALTAAQGKVLKDTLDTTVSSSFGVGQTWQDFTTSRVSGTTYTNSTGKPILVVVNTYGGTSIVDGVTLRYRGDDSEGDWSFIVPSGSTYSVTGDIRSLAELR